MERNHSEITLRADATALSAFLDGLLADLANTPSEIRDFLNFLESSPELISFECGVAAGAVVTVLLKPSQRLLDFGAAIRAGNFDFLRIKHSHGFSFVDNGSGCVSILSTSEKPPIY